MADRIVQLIDGRNNDNIYPVSINDAPIITVTSTDPGAGSSLATNHFVAVTGAQSTVGAADISSNAVTTAKIADNAVTADKINFATLGGNYSTSEVDTGFTWINGKSIYKKTVDMGALPNNAFKNVNHNISNFEMLVKAEGAMLSSDSWAPLPQNLYGVSSLYGGTGIAFRVTASAITIATTSDQSNKTAYITLYYTKSA